MSGYDRGVTTISDVRARSRAEARAVVLDAAREVAITQGWRAVRMGDLANRVGVSRQALHQEFGAKGQLGAALLHREIDELVAGFATALADHPSDVRTAFRDAAAFALTAIDGDPLLQTVISGRGDETLLALLTSRGDWLILRVAEVIREWATAEFTELSPDRVATMAEPLARLALSNAVAPTAAIDEAAESLAEVACLLLGVGGGSIR